MPIFHPSHCRPLALSEDGFCRRHRIHLSGNHTLNDKPFHDICDELAGKYPKDFKFTGWHPQCRCFVTTILKTKEERDEDVKKILRGEPVNGESVNKVKDVPQQFKATRKGYTMMSTDRYMEFYDENCSDVGTYIASVAWQSSIKRGKFVYGGGHCTIIKRLEDGSLKYIEPQWNNQSGSGNKWQTLEDYICKNSEKNISWLAES